MTGPHESHSGLFKRGKHRIKPNHEGLGKKAEVKYLYESPSLEEYPGAINWVESEPPALPATKKLRFHGAAIHVYKRAQREAGMYGSSIPFVADSIRLQSPHLRSKLDSILEKHGAEKFEYKGYTEIKKPFAPLFYERDQIQELADSAEDAETKEHLDLLVDVLRDTLAPAMTQLEEIENSGQVAFEDLWLLFVPDEMVIVKGEHYELGAKITRSRNGTFELKRSDSKTQSTERKGMLVTSKRVCFNGLQYGLNEKKVFIPEYEGKMKVCDLEVYPLRLDKDPIATRKRFEDNGKRVLEYQDVGYAVFQNLSNQDIGSASAQAMKDFWRTDKYIGRVIVDFLGFGRRNEHHRRLIEPLPEYNTQDAVGFLALNSDESFEEKETASEITTENRRPNAEQRAFSSRILLENADYLYMMFPNLAGYALNTNKWGEFNIERICDVTAVSEPYDHLVMHPRKKELIYSVVRNHSILGPTHTDVISGKGRGLLILLSGPPGVGKTLCAEAVAEKLGRPLVCVSPKDFNDGEPVSDKLREVLRRANEWKAILLFDEVDVFLSKRGSETPRDGVVSAFLWHLERHRGVVFIITNLFNELDIAVESRAHIHVKFPALDRPSRRLIWSRFIARSKEASGKFTTADLDELSRWHLSGRQIKNSLSVALAWAAETTTPISPASLEETIELTCPGVHKGEIDEQKQETHMNGLPKRPGGHDLLDLS